MDKNTFIKLYDKSKSTGDLLKKLGKETNGREYKELDILLKKYNLSRPKLKRDRIYPEIIKKCPICGNDFKTSTGAPREKIVCSRSCSNTYFRSGKDNPNYKNTGNLSHNKKYIRICFENHKKECVICGEKEIVAVHHNDYDHNNNEPMNLIPLCPTHHVYIHTNRLKENIQIKINNYILTRR